MNDLSGLKKKLIIDVSVPWLLENPPIKMNEKKRFWCVVLWLLAGKTLPMNMNEKSINIWCVRPQFLDFEEIIRKNTSTKIRYLNSVSKWKLLTNDCYKTISGHFPAICTFIFHKAEVQTVIYRCLIGLNLKFWKYDSWFPSEVPKLTPAN